MRASDAGQSRPAAAPVPATRRQARHTARARLLSRGNSSALAHAPLPRGHETIRGAQRAATPRPSSQALSLGPPDTPRRRYTQLRPRFSTERLEAGGFQSHVLLPINSPVDRALGLPQRSKVLAAASACLEAVQALHKVRGARRMQKLVWAVVVGRGRAALQHQDVSVNLAL